MDKARLQDSPRFRTSLSPSKRGPLPNWPQREGSTPLICSPAMPRHSSRILDLAKRGAEAKLQDLIHEAKMLLELFPPLRDSFDKTNCRSRSSWPGALGG